MSGRLPYGKVCRMKKMRMSGSIHWEEFALGLGEDNILKGKSLGKKGLATFYLQELVGRCNA